MPMAETGVISARPARAKLALKTVVLNSSHPQYAPHPGQDERIAMRAKQLWRMWCGR